MKLFLTSFLLILTITLYSTPEYSVETGRSCIDCHKNSDGGKLTPYGEVYLETLIREENYEPVSKTRKIARGILGFIHFLTAFIWFGAILYIHLILKPKYVAQGIPKGELKLGWRAMILMLITGIFLTINKYSKFSLLFESEIGILLVIKISLFLFMVFTIMIVTFHIAPKLNKQSKEISDKTEGEFTLDELEYFDGKEGRPAYIAYNGDVFDVTLSAFWYNGLHVLKHNAGMDLTTSMPLAPHNENVLKGFIKKGTIVKEKKTKKKPIIKLFYFLAYSVLVCIFLIIVILSMWRWWY